MIDISSLTHVDIGKRVTYTEEYKLPGKEGVIKSWDRKNVHIEFNFRTNRVPISISPKELEFIKEEVV